MLGLQGHKGTYSSAGQSSLHGPDILEMHGPDLQAHSLVGGVEVAFDAAEAMWSVCGNCYDSNKKNDCSTVKYLGKTFKAFVKVEKEPQISEILFSDSWQ